MDNDEPIFTVETIMTYLQVALAGIGAVSILACVCFFAGYCSKGGV